MIVKKPKIIFANNANKVSVAYDMPKYPVLVTIDRVFWKRLTKKGKAAIYVWVSIMLSCRFGIKSEYVKL